MKKLNYPFSYLLISLSLITAYSCSRQKGANAIIVQAESIVEQQPDSALRLLNTVLFPEDLSKSLFNKYNLLLLEAKDKSYNDITSDTVIFAVKAYYAGKKDYPNAAKAAFYCGRVRHEQDNMDEAARAYMEADDIAGKTDNYNLKGLIQANLGILNYDHSSYDKAIELNKNAIAMYDKAKNYKNKIISLRTIGDCFLLNNKIDSAFQYYNESLILADSCKMTELQSDIKNSMGVAYREQASYKQAKKLFIEALALSNDSVEQARILLNIAQAYVHEDRTDSANFYFDKALAFSISDPALMRFSYLLRSKLAEKNDRYSEALNDYKEYYRYTAKVFDNEKNNKLLEVQGKYDYEKLKNAQNRLIIKQQSAGIILFLSLLAAGIVIYIFYRKSVRNKYLLAESEQKIESLQKTSDIFSKKNQGFHKVLLKQVGILKKTALLGIEFSQSQREEEKRILDRMNRIVYEKNTWDWDQLYQAMNEARNGLYERIRIKYPQLNEMEFRICCLTCEKNFPDKEIEKITGVDINSIHRMRPGLRKKLGMPERENFLDFFENELR